MKKAQLKELRNKFRESVFERDNYACRMCGKHDKLSAHHIQDRSDMPNGGYVLQNGITLCDGGPESCHFKAEAEHNGLQPLPGYSRAELYALIGTTFDEAWEASERLSILQK